MRTPQFALLSLAVAAALASSALAQGDDCSGALNVVQGANGPFTNVGSTTSTPAWPCAAGGNDVWFSWVAPGAGNLTADLCGSGFDTALEIFDGTAGCGSLTSLACNDDSCGLESSVTVPVTSGTLYYIRVGGWASSTGTFTLNINGPAGSGTLATASNYGTGCVGIADTSFYELFATGTHDLSNTGMSLVRTGTTFLALPGLTTYVAPSGSATSLALTDDSQATVALSAPMPYGRSGSTSALTVCSNGFVSVASGNGTGFTPNVTTMLNNGQTGWYNWHDYNPAIAGSGQVKFEEVSGIAYITWDNVFNFAGAAPGSTFQFQFELATGTVHYVWQTMSLLGNSHLVGFSEGGVTADPGTTDISVALPGTFNAATFLLRPIAFAASARPIGGTTINLNTSNIGATAPFGAVALGFSNPALDLTGLGMAGCTQYTDNLATLLFLPFGSPTASTAFAVPSAPFAIGVHILSQSFVYDPAAGLTLLGALASNGIDLGIGNL